MRSEDVVVIGAGVAGLVSAIELARAGFNVTLVERAACAGGKMREVAVGDTRMDAGPTVFTMRWVFDEIFAAAGSSLEDHLKLRPAEVLARHAWGPGERLDLFADVDRSARAIGDFAGGREAAGYRAFCDEARRIYDTLKTSFLTTQRAGPVGLTRSILSERAGDLMAIRPFDTMWRALGSHFADPRLRQLFGRYATYCGSSPFAAPATLMLIAHVEQAGVWTVDGGMQRLAEALERLAVSLGVSFRYHAHVERIGVGLAGAESVTLVGGERLSADWVVVNADAGALGAGVFGRDAARALRPVAARARSLSAVTWALEGVASGFDLSRHNVFFSNDYAAEFDDMIAKGRLPGGPTVYLCAQDRVDGSPAPDGAERLFLLVNAPANGDQGGLDTSEVAACGNRVFNQLEAYGLEVTPSSAPVVTTPMEFNSLFPGTGSALRARDPRLGGGVRASGSGDANTGALHGGGRRPSGGGGADGGVVGALGGATDDPRPRFDAPIPPGGYAWWYVDAISDDGRHGLTLIAFIGSVFSPYYAWSGWADPLNHCAVNVALYGPKANRWAMTERGRGSMSRDKPSLSIGPSTVTWEGDTLEIAFDEVTAPIPSRLRGTVRVHADALLGQTFVLDGPGRHRWRPIAPRARIEVSVESPALTWSGEGYFDTNVGDEPLERAFVSWDWSRAHLSGDTLLFYDAKRRDGGAANLALRVSGDRLEHIESPPSATLAPTFWRVPRTARGNSLQVRQTLEDTPFYTRSVLTGRYSGEPASIIHESLSLDRLRSPVVKAMLPFRMPRAFR